MVDPTQLAVVVGAEAVLVGDLVDAFVVGVDERLAGAHQAVDLGDEGAQGAVADEAGAAEVGIGEARLGELGLGDDRRALAAERLVPLEPGGREQLAGVAVGGGPAQHVEHLAVDRHAVADDAVLTRAKRRWRSTSARWRWWTARPCVTGPPSSTEQIVGASAARVSSCRQPRPSIVSSTVDCSASATGRGTQSGTSSGGCCTMAATFDTQGPV